MMPLYDQKSLFFLISAAQEQVPTSPFILAKPD